MRRWLLGAAGGCAVLAIAGWMAVGPLMSPTFRQTALEVLGRHFGGNAELKSLDVTLFPKPRITGEGLVLRHRGRTDIPPLLAVERFAASTTWVGLLRRPRRVAVVELQGLRLHIPAREAGESIVPDSLKDAVKPQAAASDVRQAATVVIDRVSAMDARLEIATKDPSKPPRTFAIHRVELAEVAGDRPARFTAALTNPKPPGDIETHGELGPWSAGEPGDTPVRGDFTFARADLGVFTGIDGTLASKGTYAGVLERIAVKGEALVPDFALTTAGNPVALSTAFDAVVDGTNGNTWLNTVRATFGSSSLTARGGVVRTGDGLGREVALVVSVVEARVEDLLRLAMKGNAVMTGDARIDTKLRLPPGDTDVIRKIELDGEFHISSARFTSVDVQKSIAALSRTGRGVKDAERGTSVVSDLQGRFVVKNAEVRFSTLTFAVPGASVRLAGAYGVASEQIDFKGALRLQASLSQTQTGVKALLLKMVDPLFRKNGAGAEIPIKVTGSRSQPKFGLDVGRVLGGK